MKTCFLYKERTEQLLKITIIFLVTGTLNVTDKALSIYLELYSDTMISSN